MSRDAATGRVERALIGSLLLDPRLRKFCARLKASHFTTPETAKAWEKTMEMDKPDVVLLFHAMETSMTLPPRGYVGWGSFLSDCLYDACPIDESVGDYADVIRAEAAVRKRVPW